MIYQNTRRGFTQVAHIPQAQPDNTTNCHSKLDLESPHVLLWNNEILNQVQDDKRMGFTLIELLVVVFIIGILAAVALPQYQLTVEKSRAAEAITSVRALAQAQQLFYLEHGRYTNKFADLNVDFNSSISRSDVKQYKDWYLSLTSVLAHSRVYAGKGHVKNATLFKNGRWYISYFLSTRQMYCCAYNTDIKSTRICRAFSTKEGIPISDLTCYPLD